MHKAPKTTRSRLIYQILGICLLCILFVSITYTVTLAWFMDESTTSTGEPDVNVLVVGTVDLDVTTNFNFYNLALAPDTTYLSGEINGETVSYATKLKTSDNNDIGNVYVRVKFTVENRPELTLYFGEDRLTTETEYNSQSAGRWYYNAEIDENDDGVVDSGDGYYYYIGSVGSEEVIFNDGYHVSNSLHNGIAGEPVNFGFEVEAIQRPYGAYTALWTTAPAVFNDFASDTTTTG